jgi:hypothetical protein
MGRKKDNFEALGYTFREFRKDGTEVDTSKPLHIPADKTCEVMSILNPGMKFVPCEDEKAEKVK